MQINKETQALNDTLNKIDSIDKFWIDKTVHPKQQNTLSSQVLMYHSTMEREDDTARKHPCSFEAVLPLSCNILQDRSYPGSQIKPW